MSSNLHVLPPEAPVSLPISPGKSAPEKLLFTTTDLGRALGTSLATIHRLKAAGKLPRALKLGAQLRWDAGEIREWIAAGMPDQRTWEVQRKAGFRRYIDQGRKPAPLASELDPPAVDQLTTGGRRQRTKAEL